MDYKVGDIVRLISKNYTSGLCDNDIDRVLEITSIELKERGQFSNSPYVIAFCCTTKYIILELSFRDIRLADAFDKLRYEIKKG